MDRPRAAGGASMSSPPRSARAVSSPRDRRASCSSPAAPTRPARPPASPRSAEPRTSPRSPQLRPARERRCRRVRLPRPLRAARDRPRGGPARARRGQRAGRRPRRPLRRGRALAGPAPRRLDRHRAHPHRPRRDDALPARGLARQARDPRVAGAPRPGDAPAARPRTRRDQAARGRRGPAVCRRSRRNDDPAFARNRIRAEVLPVLRELSPAAERNLAETRAELAEESAVLERLVAELLDTAGAGGEVTAVSADSLAGAEPAPRPARAARRSPSAPRGRDVAIGRDRAGEILRLASSSEGGQVDLGGGLRAVCEGGFVSFSSVAADAAPEPANLAIPGDVPVWPLAGPRRDPPGTGRSRRTGARHARRRAAGRGGRRPGLARGRPDPPARAGRLEVASGPLHRPARAALDAALAAGGRGRRPRRLGRRGRGLGGVQARPRRPARSPC